MELAQAWAKAVHGGRGRSRLLGVVWSYELGHFHNQGTFYFFISFANLIISPLFRKMLAFMYSELWVTFGLLGLQTGLFGITFHIS